MRRATYQELVRHCLKDVPSSSSERETFLRWFDYWIHNTVPFRAPELTGQCLKEFSEALENAFCTPAAAEDLEKVQHRFNTYVKCLSEQKKPANYY